MQRWNIARYGDSHGSWGDFMPCTTINGYLKSGITIITPNTVEEDFT